MNDAAPAQNPILRIEGLGFVPAGGRDPVLEDFSLDLTPGEIVAVLGRRGSGRPLLRDLVLGLHLHGKITGTVERAKEGKRIAYLPGYGESPLLRHGSAARQLTRLLALRTRQSYANAERALRTTLARFPGGLTYDELRRRPQDLNRRSQALGLLALALAQQPDVIVADDPSADLDPVDGEELLGLLLAARAEHGFALLYLTGNPIAAARLGGRIAVLRDGRLIEEGASHILRDEQLHPYTRTLFRSVPLLRDSGGASGDMRGEPLLEVRNFALGKAAAAQGLSFELRKGASLALIGVEGSGRRAIARAILGLDRAPQGRIIFDAVDVGVLSPRLRMRLRKRIAYISGDDAVLDPRMTVLETVAEPIHAQLRLGRAQIERAARAALNRARLADVPEHWLAGDLDALQRRRLQVARAWAAAPQLVVLYEPLTGLGALGGALMLDLLKAQRASETVATLVATADFALAQTLAGHGLVIREGALIESGAMDVLIRAPKHQYTKALVEAAWRRTRLEPPALTSAVA